MWLKFLKLQVRGGDAAKSRQDNAGLVSYGRGVTETVDFHVN